MVITEVPKAWTANLQAYYSPRGAHLFPAVTWAEAPESTYWGLMCRWNSFSIVADVYCSLNLIFLLAPHFQHLPSNPMPLPPAHLNMWELVETGSKGGTGWVAVWKGGGKLSFLPPSFSLDPSIVASLRILLENKIIYFSDRERLYDVLQKAKLGRQ